MLLFHYVNDFIYFRPANSIIWHLNKLKFDKEIYIIGFETLRNELKEAGYKVVYDEVCIYRFKIMLVYTGNS